MQIDFLTLACLRDHLDTLLGARVQRAVLPDRRSVGLELYAGQRMYLLASADPQMPYLVLTPERARRGVETQTPFLLLLRKWVRRARLLDITQPPWERILRFHFDGPAGRCQLVVELVGRYSNIVLVGPDGLVLEAVKHVGPQVNRYRVTLPAQPYQLPPPPPNRRPPVGVSAAAMSALLARADPDIPLHRWLVETFLGVSRTLAREVAVRVASDAGVTVRDAAPEAIARALGTLMLPLENGWWTPHVALDAHGEVTAVTPYRPQQFEQAEAVPDINQALWRYFEARQMTDAYAAARRAVYALVNRAQSRLDRRLEKLQAQLGTASDVDELRLSGELLLTYQQQIPAGASEATLPDYTTGQPRVIPLDPKLSPTENAQAYFRRYEKARRAAKQVPALIEALEADRAYLAQLGTDLALAETRPEIDAVRDALTEAGWAPKKRRRSGGQVSEPRRFEIKRYVVFVGRNALQNEQVTFRRAGPEDLWLHVRGLPGAHVVLKRRKQPVPEEVLARAAQLAAYYSAARDSTGKVPVDVTERRFVRRIKGPHPGLVTYRNEQTLWVRPQAVEYASVD